MEMYIFIYCPLNAETQKLHYISVKKKELSTDLTGMSTPTPKSDTLLPKKQAPVS